MLKRTYLRTIAIFFLLVLLVFSVLSAFLLGQSVLRTENEVRARMEIASESTMEILRAWLEAEKSDLNSLLRTRAEDLGRLFRIQAENAGCSMFLINQKGELLLSSDSAVFAAESVKSGALSELWESASSSRFLNGDLGGFLKNDSFYCVALLEKEFLSPSQEVIRQQIAGALILSRPSSFFGRNEAVIAAALFIAAALVFSLTAAGLVFFTRKFVDPLRLTSEAAERYARGDFSYRLPVRGHDETAALMQALNEMAQSLEKLERTRSDFIANISHDLRTPLTAISGFVQNMLEGAIPEEKRDRYLKTILDETHRLSHLVETLLRMSRMDAGEQRFEFAPFDLPECARRTLITFEKRITDKKIEVEFDSPDELSVFGDEDGVHQVIANLVDNAVKFTPEGGVIRMKIAVQGAKAALSLYNTGEGIPPEELPEVFDRFYKTDRSRSLDKSGMGLGLYISRSVIKAHGEEIWVTSEVGKFTEFVFTLKLDPNKIK